MSIHSTNVEIQRLPYFIFQNYIHKQHKHLRFEFLGRFIAYNNYHMKQEYKNSQEQEISWQQEKLKAIYHKIDNCLDRFIDLYVQAERAIQSGQNHQQVIQSLNKQLLNLKPLKTVREHFVHHYRKLSNLIRKLQIPSTKHAIANSRYSRRAMSEQPNIQQEAKQTDERYNQFFKGFIKNNQDHQLFQQMIVQNYLRKGEWECADVWPELENNVDPSGLFRQSINMRECIKKGKLIQAIKWCQTQRLYETYECFLQYDLKLMHLLGLIQSGNSSQILTYYMNSFNKFLQSKKEQIEKLFLHILFKTHKFWDGETLQTNFKQKIEDRYKNFHYSQQKLLALSQQFYRQYLKHYNLCKFNSLQIIFNCSQTIMDEYLRMMKLVWGGKQKDKKQAATLPFSVKTALQYQYHSLFYCPITKEVQPNNQPSKLLACGHLISENAHHRIVQQNRNRRKIKCPICQKQIRAEESLKTQF